MNHRSNETTLPFPARFESTLETADGRTLELHRDESGRYWILERQHGRHRVVPLSEYAWECHAAARVLRARQLGLLAARLRYLAGRLRSSLSSGALHATASRVNC